MSSHDTSGQVTPLLGSNIKDPSSSTKAPRARSFGLMRVSEVERFCTADSSLHTILRWIRGFLAHPHPDLGRSGTVCPFVPVSLGLDTIWMMEVLDASGTVPTLSEIIERFRDVFLETEPTTGPDSLNKSFLIVFPLLEARGAAVVDQVQAALKRHFVEVGLMIGEFHPGNETPGLRNPAFRPLRSPLPMLAIRHMVDSDLPFLSRKHYPPTDRSAYLRSYLFRLGGRLSQGKFDEAIQELLAAEIAMAEIERRHSGRQKGPAQ